MSEDNVVSDAYPPNRLRDQRARASEAAKGPKKPEERTPQEPVVTGNVVRRKKGFWKRSKDYVQSEEFHAIGGYLVHEVAIPNVRRLLFDIVNNGASRVFLGTNAPMDIRRSLGIGGGGRPNYTQYAAVPKVTEQRPTLSTQGRRYHDFSEILFETREDAFTVLEHLVNLIDTYGRASVVDLYELVNIEALHTDLQWGWTNLDRAGVDRIAAGYLLDLPRPIDLR